MCKSHANYKNRYIRYNCAIMTDISIFNIVYVIYLSYFIIYSCQNGRNYLVLFINLM